jgi:RNA recognition motif-containing protein
MSTRLRVRNLSATTTEATLHALFASDGRRVERISVVTDRITGEPKRFGFVQMASPEDAVAAMAAVNGQEIDGNLVSVSEAKPRT